MAESRIVSAMTRIEAAMKRIEDARAQSPDNSNNATDDNAGSAKVTALVNAHEKLREEVAETMREIDSVIEGLEG